MITGIDFSRLYLLINDSIKEYQKNITLSSLSDDPVRAIIYSCVTLAHKVCIIHPFADCNLRTAQQLLNKLLLENNLPLTLLKEPSMLEGHSSLELVEEVIQGMHYFKYLAKNDYFPSTEPPISEKINPMPRIIDDKLFMSFSREKRQLLHIEENCKFVCHLLDMEHISRAFFCQMTAQQLALLCDCNQDFYNNTKLNSISTSDYPLEEIFQCLIKHKINQETYLDRLQRDDLSKFLGLLKHGKVTLKFWLEHHLFDRWPNQKDWRKLLLLFIAQSDRLSLDKLFALKPHIQKLILEGSLLYSKLDENFPNDRDIFLTMSPLDIKLLDNLDKFDLVLERRKKESSILSRLITASDESKRTWLNDRAAFRNFVENKTTVKQVINNSSSVERGRRKNNPTHHTAKTSIEKHPSLLCHGLFKDPPTINASSKSNNVDEHHQSPSSVI